MIPNLKYYSKYISLMLSTALVLASCSDDKFKIKGEIYGAEDKTIVLEKSDFQGKWLPVDSTHTNKNGGFSFSFPAPMSPEIYRLTLNNQYVYLPVDSTETLTLTTSYDKFGSDFSLTGSRNAENLTEFEKSLQQANTENQDSLYSFKRSVYSNYMKDFPGSILSFYILTKIIDGKPLYDPSDKTDLKYFTAVATGYQAVRPDDPRASLLEQTALRALKKQNSESGKFSTIEANEIAMIEIDQQDETGKNVKLSSVVGKGKPVVVIFSLLTHEDSPELNMQLAKLYNDMGGKVEFYNVSLDPDQYSWREAAKNLPWITVYSPGQGQSVDAVRYNVFQIPSYFIYNGQGELSSRPMTVEELRKSL